MEKDSASLNRDSRASSAPASGSPVKPGLHVGWILRARCPACGIGPVTRGIFSIHPACTNCGYSFNPENGFYLGAVAISYLLTAILTIPPVIALKVMQVDIGVLIAFPLVEFVFLGTFLLYYSRVLWLHLEYRMSHRLDGGSR